jgi:hypothetical protein
VDDHGCYVVGGVNERCWMIVGVLLVWVTMNLTLLLDESCWVIVGVLLVWVTMNLTLLVE